MNQKFVTSNITYSMDPWRRVLLFGSWRQFHSFLIAVALAVCVVAVAANVLMPNMNSPAVLFTVPAGAVLAALFVVAGTLPATFSIRTDDTRYSARLVGIMEEQVCRLGYRRETPGDLCYVPKTPRWLAWDENRIRIVCEETVVTLYGPKMALRALKRRLEATSKDW